MMEWRLEGENFFEANVEWYTLVMAFANFNQKTHGRYFGHIFMIYNNWGEVGSWGVEFLVKTELSSLRHECGVRLYKSYYYSNS